MAHGTAHIGTEKYRVAITVDGHAITADEPEKLGGRNAGPAPYDLILAGLGACTAITLKMYADRKEYPLESLNIDLRLHGDKPADFQIERRLTIKGVDAEQAARLADIAERTPVTLTLKNGLPIHTTLNK